MEIGNVFFIARCDFISCKESKRPVCALRRMPQNNPPLSAAENISHASVC